MFFKKMNFKFLFRVLVKNKIKLILKVLLRVKNQKFQKLLTLRRS